jgi:hypothetical protein
MPRSNLKWSDSVACNKHNITLEKEIFGLFGLLVLINIIFVKFVGYVNGCFCLLEDLR